ncbi:MAG: hypothetical protein AB7I50_21625 [Vicinamibacterales bacterium]
MSPDEVQRTMQFLLNQQAQTAAKLDRLDDTVEKLSKKTDRVIDAVMGLTGVVGNLAAQQERTGEQVRQLAEHQERTDRQLRELATHQERTESNLNALIAMFERHLREDQGGQRPS